MLDTIAQMFEITEKCHDLEWDRILPLLEAVRHVAGAYDVEWLKEESVGASRSCGD